MISIPLRITPTHCLLIRLVPLSTVKHLCPLIHSIELELTNKICKILDYLKFAQGMTKEGTLARLI